MWARLMKVSRTLGGAGAVFEMGLAVVGGRAPSVSFDSALRAALGMKGARFRGLTVNVHNRLRTRSDCDLRLPNADA